MWSWGKVPPSAGPGCNTGSPIGRGIGVRQDMVVRENHSLCCDSCRRRGHRGFLRSRRCELIETPARGRSNAIGGLDRRERRLLDVGDELDVAVLGGIGRETVCRRDAAWHGKLSERQLLVLRTRSPPVCGWAHQRSTLRPTANPLMPGTSSSRVSRPNPRISARYSRALALAMSSPFHDLLTSIAQLARLARPAQQRTLNYRSGTCRQQDVSDSAANLEHEDGGAARSSHRARTTWSVVGCCGWLR